MAKKNESDPQDVRKEAWSWAIKTFTEDPKRLGDLAGLVGAMVKDAEQKTQEQHG